MKPFPIPMPGAQRLRNLQPLIDGDGACSLVYDVERATVFEVPEDLRLHVAPALETGDLDEDLLGWLVGEDLLTSESDWSAWSSWHDSGLGAADLACGDALSPLSPFASLSSLSPLSSLAKFGELPIALAGAGPGADEIHGWIDQAAEGPALDAVEMLFKRGFGRSRFKVHLDWNGLLPPASLLEKVVGEARRRAALALPHGRPHGRPPGSEIAFELALDPSQVTADVARRVTALGLQVRLRCGEVDPHQLGTALSDRPWLPAESAVRLLLGATAQGGLLPAAGPEPALTVQCVLVGSARLIELWRWAKSIGVRRLDAIRLEDSGACSPASAERWREYRQDLQAVYEETCGDLAAGRMPVEFQPLTRVVRRLNGREARVALGASFDAVGRWGGAGGSFEWLAMLDPRQLPELAWIQLAGPAPAHRRSAAGAGSGLGRDAAPRLPAAAFGGPAEPADPGDLAEMGQAAACPCQSCWARQVCNHSAFVASPLGSEDPREPSRDRCAAWTVEVEMALRLHHHLAQIDAMQVTRFLHGEQGTALAASLPMPPLLQPHGYGDLLSMKPS